MSSRRWFLPNASQRLLLQAALLGGDAACLAWAEWHTYNDSNSIDSGSYRLLPLVFDNLTRQGCTGPSMGRLKGVYRLTWSKNQFLFRCAAQALAPLKIDTMLLKGAVLNLAYYRSPALRPMDDVDVLVHREDAFEVAQCLFAQGWSLLRYPDHAMAKIIQRRHSAGLGHPDGGRIDLHWNLFTQASSRTALMSLWKYDWRVEMAGFPLRVPNPADLLLHVCLHGVRYNLIPSIRWIADASIVLQQDHYRIDWDYFVEQAQRWQINLAVHRAMSYLREEFAMPIPSQVITQLADIPVSIHQLVLFHSEAQPSPNFWSRLYPFIPWTWWHFITDSYHGSFPRRLVTSLPLLKQRKSLRQLLTTRVGTLLRVFRKASPRLR